MAGAFGKVVFGEPAFRPERETGEEDGKGEGDKERKVKNKKEQKGEKERGTKTPKKKMKKGNEVEGDKKCLFPLLTTLFFFVSFSLTLFLSLYFTLPLHLPLPNSLPFSHNPF
jgi:hypothetical protein